MTVWMLIVAFHVGYGGGAVLNLGDFATRESCLFASGEVLKLSAEQGGANAKCVQVQRPAAKS